MNEHKPVCICHVKSHKQAWEGYFLMGIILLSTVSLFLTRCLQHVLHQYMAETRSKDSPLSVGGVTGSWVSTVHRICSWQSCLLSVGCPCSKDLEFSVPFVFLFPTSTDLHHLPLLLSVPSLFPLIRQKKPIWIPLSFLGQRWQWKFKMMAVCLV